MHSSCRRFERIFFRRLVMKHVIPSESHSIPSIPFIPFLPIPFHSFLPFHSFFLPCSCLPSFRPCVVLPSFLPLPLPFPSGGAIVSIHSDQVDYAIIETVSICPASGEMPYRVTPRLFVLSFRW